MTSFKIKWQLFLKKGLDSTQNFELFIFDYLFQYGGTNFTAFRMIDTNKFEVKTVIKDIVSREMTLGHPLNIEVSEQISIRLNF